MNNDIIFSYLDEVIPNPKCELEYSKDYELLIAIMLSAQTTDKRVNLVTRELFNKYPSLKELKEANLEDIKSIVRQLGNFNKKALAVLKIANILYNDYNGIVPRKRELLEKLPLVGRKTVSVFLLEYYDEPNMPVDTHVERVSKRLGFCKKDDDVLTIERKLKKKIPKDKWNRLHQQMVLFGRYHCTAKNPKCENCKLNSICKKGVINI